MQWGMPASPKEVWS